MRLTLHPHEIAAGTQNPTAGEYPLKSASDAIVSMPLQCVGAHRCPLLVVLPSAGFDASKMTVWFRPMADKYGIALLALTKYERSDMDVALKETFQTFAIDLDKVAVLGRCITGAQGMRFGTDNMDVFSRIISVSGGIVTDGIDPQNKTAEFLLDDSYFQAGGLFGQAQALRRDGHIVKDLLGLRGHEHQEEDYDFVGHWLQESWTNPNPATRPAPAIVADTMPKLTTDILAKMTAFWKGFLQEPDWLWMTARRAYLHEVLVRVGDKQASVWMTDMPLMAAKYPSVAAALKRAGLTAKQHDAYRVAIISAGTSQIAAGEAVTLNPASVQAQNLEFLEAHPKEAKEFRDVGIIHP